MAEITIKDFLDTFKAAVNAVNDHTAALTANTDGLTALRLEIKAWREGAGVPDPDPDPDPIPEPEPPASTQKWWFKDRQFTKNGKPVFVKGASIRAGAYFIENDRPHVLNYMTSGAHQDDLESTLDAAKNMGIHWIRFYAAISTYPDGMPGTPVDYCIRRTEEMLNLIAARDMGAIVVLDENASSQFHVFDGQHDGDAGRPTSWFVSGYKDKYQKFVAALVGALRDHEGVAAWELGNEYHLRAPYGMTEAKAVYDFMLDMGKFVKGLSPKMVFPGNETLWQLFASSRSLCDPFVKAKVFHALCLHLYDPSAAEPLGRWTELGQAPNLAGKVDLKLAADYNVPVYVGEFGVSRDSGFPGDAPKDTETFLVYAKSIGIGAVCQWLLAKAETRGKDLGWHDGASMDNASNGHLFDFDRMVNVWSKPR